MYFKIHVPARPAFDQVIEADTEEEAIDELAGYLADDPLDDATIVEKSENPIDEEE